MSNPHERPNDGPAAALAQRVAAQVPQIETTHLTLRAPRIEDFAIYSEIVLSARGRFILEEPSREVAWFDFTQMIATWMLRGHGAWAIADTGTAEVLGFVLIGFEPGDQEPELGFMLRAEAEGRGLATEACEAILTFAFRALRLKTLVSYVAPGNTRAERLAVRLGAFRDDTAEAALSGAAQVYRYNRMEDAE